MLRLIGCIGWAGIAGFVGAMLATALPSLRPFLQGEILLLLAGLAIAAALLTMITHINVNHDLSEEDKKTWRALLVWGGPITASWYLTSRDRHIASRENVKKLLTKLW